MKEKRHKFNRCFSFAITIIVVASLFTACDIRDKSNEDQIGALFDEIMYDADESSWPRDCLEAHDLEHQKLLENKDDTLRYIFNEFLRGQQGSYISGLKGRLMRVILDELCPESMLDMWTESGQEYFNAWMAKALEIVSNNDDEWVKEKYPEVQLLSDMFDLNANIKSVVKEGRGTYFELSDDTWLYDGLRYKYRLEISGRMPNAVGDSTFVFLSNIEDINFEQAYKQITSSDSNDFFLPEEAVLVELY